MPRCQRSNIGRRTNRLIRENHNRQNETIEQRNSRNDRNREQMNRSRSRSNPQGGEQRRPRERPLNLEKVAFAYDPTVDYSVHRNVVIGAMDVSCPSCHALKFKNETVGMCCLSGKVKLPELRAPPEPLKSLLNGAHPLSNQFLMKIRYYNSCFQMTSFGATKIIREGNFMPTFKVKSSYRDEYIYQKSM